MCQLQHHPLAQVGYTTVYTTRCVAYFKYIPVYYLYLAVHRSVAVYHIGFVLQPVVRAG